jgi:hypothetical protein
MKWIEIDTCGDAKPLAYVGPLNCGPMTILKQTKQRLASSTFCSDSCSDTSFNVSFSAFYLNPAST